MIKLKTKTHIYLCLSFTIILLSFSAFNLQAQKKATKPERAVKHAANKRVFYGEASFYADKFNGRHTANGEIFSQNKLTCACNMLPFGTLIKVTNVRNGKWAIVKVNDRLHPRMKRIVDLTKATAIKLGFHGNGVARVKVEFPVKKI